MRRVALGLLVVIGGYLVVRAVAEPFVIDMSDPASYRNDWGGPSLTGVLAVHILLGLVAAAVMVVALARRRRRPPTTWHPRHDVDRGHLP